MARLRIKLVALVLAASAVALTAERAISQVQESGPAGVQPAVIFPSASQCAGGCRPLPPVLAATGTYDCRTSNPPAGVATIVVVTVDCKGDCKLTGTYTAKTADGLNTVTYNCTLTKCEGCTVK